MMKKKPLIFITNDDGIHAKGIRALIEAVDGLGEIVVVAPDRGMSGMSHALTVSTILRLHKLVEEDGFHEYTCPGTPVDCLKLARYALLERNPDLVISGINHGSNSSINVIYSGTAAAAIEGALNGIPSIAFSLLDHSAGADFTAAKHFARKIIMDVLEKGMPQNTCLNVNIPKLPINEIKGVKICRQAIADWEDAYVEKIDPNGHKYYWLTGQFVNKDTGEDTDEYALQHQYISVVPVHIDYTNHSAINKMQYLETEL